MTAGEERERYGPRDDTVVTELRLSRLGAVDEDALVTRGSVLYVRNSNSRRCVPLPSRQSIAPLNRLLDIGVRPALAQED